MPDRTDWTAGGGGLNSLAMGGSQFEFPAVPQAVHQENAELAMERDVLERPVGQLRSWWLRGCPPHMRQQHRVGSHIAESGSGVAAFADGLVVSQAQAVHMTPGLLSALPQSELESRQVQRVICARQLVMRSTQHMRSESARGAAASGPNNTHAEHGSARLTARNARRRNR